MLVANKFEMKSRLARIPHHINKKRIPMKILYLNSIFSVINTIEEQVEKSINF